MIDKAARQDAGFLVDLAALQDKHVETAKQLLGDTPQVGAPVGASRSRGLGGSGSGSRGGGGGGAATALLQALAHHHSTGRWRAGGRRGQVEPVHSHAGGKGRGLRSVAASAWFDPGWCAALPCSSTTLWLAC